MFHLRICIPWDHHHHLLHNISQPMMCLWQANTDLIFFSPASIHSFIKKTFLYNSFFLLRYLLFPSISRSFSRVCVALILSFSMWWWCLSHRCMTNSDFFLSLYNSVISFRSSLFFFVPCICSMSDRLFSELFFSFFPLSDITTRCHVFSFTFLSSSVIKI